MSEKPEPDQALLLWALMLNGGVGLLDQIKPRPTPKLRAPLEGLKLIKVEKVNRKLSIEVTERGWAWAAANLDAELPSRSQNTGQVLRGILSKLKEFLASQDKISLADILAPPKPHVPDRGPGEQIRAAYLKLTGGRFEARALLSDLRKELAEMDRQQFERAIEKLQIEADARLMPLDDRTAITPADEAAAIFVAGRPRHILWMTK